MRWLLLLVPMVMFGCDDAKDPEEDAPVDGKLDSFRTPTDHGELAFGQTQTATLKTGELHHTWSFSLSAPAQLHAFTSRVPHKASIDTVLYLYRRTATGWGAYIARNDDDGRADWSSIDRELPTGEYRLLVKGHAAATRGSFNLDLDCSGDGCAPVTCTFGSTYGDIADNARLLVNRHAVTSPTELSDLEKQRVIIALHQSTHTDVTTIEDALAAADQGEVNVVRIYETAAARSFTAIEYGAGDNSYGAIFGEDTLDLVASIHDGDLTGCTVLPETCLLGQDWSGLRSSAAFVTTSTRVVTQASQLTGVAATQALAAIRIGYEEATDLTNGLAMIDQGKLNVITMRHRTTGAMVDVFEYGAGDNSYGAIFHAGTTLFAAQIRDLDFYGCSLFD